jgi:hypothetical protein
MKDQRWTWEVAYKKWFFLRFFLLLVVLGLCIVLAYITFHQSPEQISQAPVNQNSELQNRYAGRYESENARIEIIPIPKNNYTLVQDDEYAILGNAIWEGPNADQGQVHEGTIEGVDIINNNHFDFYPYDNCHVSIIFNDRGLTAEDNDACGGVNVSFTGDYKKVK